MDVNASDFYDNSTWLSFQYHEINSNLKNSWQVIKFLMQPLLRELAIF